MFTKEEMEYIKNASKHVEFLLGGRGYNKTHEVIGQSLQENEKLKQALLGIKEYINDSTVFDGSSMCANDLLDMVNKVLGEKNGE